MKKIVPILMILLGILEVILGLLDIKMPVMIALVLGVLFLGWGIKILRETTKK